VHNTVVMTRSGGYFLSAPSATQSVKLTANLFAGTNNPGLITGGKAVAALDQYDNYVTAASHFKRADSLTNPNFWPDPALLAQIVLTRSPDANYLVDAPRPYASRRIPATAKRSIGALQAAP